MGFDFTKVDWETVLPKFGIAKEHLRKRHGPCPLCLGKDRFRFDNKGNMGTWYCQHCGPGNALTLLRKYTRADDRSILSDIERYNGGAPGKVDKIIPYVVSDELTPDEVEANRKRLVKAWRGSIGLSRDPVTTYLKQRVPAVELSRIGREIRYHPGMNFMEIGENDNIINRGVFPVMLARVLDGSGKPITLHRTYLTPEGRKAPFEMVKKQMSGIRKLKGAAIRLNTVPGSRVLGVCEGIETGLAIVTAYRYRMPVWSLLNCGNLAVADIPRAMFDKVIIFADHDAIDPVHGYRPGEHHANRLAERLRAQGFGVEVRVPPHEKMDFADMWVEHYHALGKAA